jgi:FkbM family methyltransferase
MLINFRDLCHKYNFTPTGIIHVGAHDLEEKPDYENMGVKKILWIEGNPEVYQKNRDLVDGSDQILLNELVWEFDNDELEFKITNNLQSSSILDMNKHKLHHPDVTVDKSILMKTKTLDSIIDEIKIDPEVYNFINLDIQGVELRALKGFSKNLKFINYIYTEVNTGEVYSDNDTMEEMDSYLTQFGFERVETNITPYEWGDAFYIKNRI